MNEILIDFLVYKLNEEMKNISKKHLTNKSKDDIITSSNEREDKSNEQT